MTVPDYIANKYSLGALLGKGRFASAYVCTNRETKELYVIKKINKSAFERDNAIELENEVNILRAAQHSNILKYIEHVDTPGYLYLFTEYVEGRTIRQYLTDGVRFSANDVRAVLGKLSSALSYLHFKLNVVHRDIKADNVMIVFNGGFADNIKLIDFGLACEIGKKVDIVLKQLLPPERVPNKRPSDIWMTGIMLLGMFHGQYICCEDTEHILKKIFEMTADDPKERPTSAELAMWIRNC